MTEQQELETIYKDGKCILQSLIHRTLDDYDVQIDDFIDEQLGQILVQSWLLKVRDYLCVDVMEPGLFNPIFMEFFGMYLIYHNTIVKVMEMR